MTYGEQRREAEGYYRLCEQAEALGIPTSIDDPDSPKTVEELREAVAAQDPIGADRAPGVGVSLSDPEAAWDSESRRSPYATVWSPEQDDDDVWQGHYDRHFAVHGDDLAATEHADANV